MKSLRSCKGRDVQNNEGDDDFSAQESHEVVNALADQCIKTTCERHSE